MNGPNQRSLPLASVSAQPLTKFMRYTRRTRVLARPVQHRWAQNYSSRIYRHEHIIDVVPNVTTSVGYIVITTLMQVCGSAMGVANIHFSHVQPCSSSAARRFASVGTCSSCGSCGTCSSSGHDAAAKTCWPPPHISFLKNNMILIELQLSCS